MAIAPSIPGVVAARPAGFEEWMSRVVERAAKAQGGLDVDDVHDLRVALRRCRTMADALSEVNPSPGWRRLKKASGGAFRALGELRDVQVMSALVKRFGPMGDPVRRHMLRLLSAKERECRAASAKALGEFDRKEWKKLARKLSAKARFFPSESVVFQRMALARLNAAAELYQRARRKRNSSAWHRLRIGLKRFRYVVDNFLPRRYELWAEDLKRVQDALGELHDLDVLRAAIRREASHFEAAAVAGWYKRIDAERKTRLAEASAKLSGSQSQWLVWRAGLPLGHSLAVAPLAQRRRTA